MNNAKGFALFGGSFNPPHIGHLRLAIEVAERFVTRFNTLLFLPSALPPHKDAAGILPFALRCDMLEECLRSVPFFALCNIEGERKGPSYTYETLKMLANTAGSRNAFILGSDDYLQLPSWYRGLELPHFADLIVVPRDSFKKDEFDSATYSLWPSAVPCTREEENGFLLGKEERVFYADVPCLPFSSTDIRRRWCAGKSVDFLVPEAVTRTLAREEQLVREIWGGVSLS